MLDDHTLRQLVRLPVYLYDDWAYITLRLPGGIATNTDAIDEALRELDKLLPNRRIKECREEVCKSGLAYTNLSTSGRLLVGLRVNLELVNETSRPLPRGGRRGPHLSYLGRGGSYKSSLRAYDKNDIDANRYTPRTTDVSKVSDAIHARYSRQRSRVHSGDTI